MIVGSVLRVKPESLRDDQPLTDLGLDSLMGAEIENSIEAAIGVGLPPTSLMRARTIGQIVALIADAHGPPLQLSCRRPQLCLRRGVACGGVRRSRGTVQRRNRRLLERSF